VLSAIHKEEVVKVFDWIFGETVTLEIGSPIFSIEGVSTDSHCFHHHHHYLSAVVKWQIYHDLLWLVEDRLSKETPDVVLILICRLPWPTHQVAHHQRHLRRLYFRMSNSSCPVRRIHWEEQWWAPY
jgi:hypothetical protein